MCTGCIAPVALLQLRSRLGQELFASGVPAPSNHTTSPTPVRDFIIISRIIQTRAEENCERVVWELRNGELVIDFVILLK